MPADFDRDLDAALDEVYRRGYALRRRGRLYRAGAALGVLALVVAVPLAVRATQNRGGEILTTASSGLTTTTSPSTSVTTVATIPSTTEVTATSEVPTSTSIAASSNSETSTTEQSVAEVTVTNADGYATITVPLQGIIHVRLTGTGPNDGWQAPSAGDASILRTDDSSDTDPADGNAQGDFTAIAEGQTDVTAVHTCTGTHCTPTVWRITVIVTA